VKSSSFCRQGAGRESNEDALLALPGKGVFLVCDGVGSGADAACDVVETFRRFFEEASPDELDRGPKFLEEAFRRANQLLLKRSFDEGAARCAAAVALLVRRGAWVVGWCGDCRAYVGTAEQLTRDHTRLQELVDRGVVVESEVDAALRKSALTKCLGSREELALEFTSERAVEPGQRVLLCSDGISDVLGKEAIASVLKVGSVEEVIEQLRTAVVGGNDDAAAVCVTFEEADCAAGVSRRVLDEDLAAVRQASTGRASGDGAISVKRPQQTLIEFLRSMPHLSRQQLLKEAALLGGLTLVCLLVPQILELVGRRLEQVGFEVWAILAVLAYLVVLRLRLR